MTRCKNMVFIACEEDFKDIYWCPVCGACQEEAGRGSEGLEVTLTFSAHTSCQEGLEERP